MPPAPTTPGDPAIAEVQARIDAIWPAWDACRAAPTCDIDAFINEFSTPNTPAAENWRQENEFFRANQLHAESLDKIQRFVASIDVTGNDAISQVCQRDPAVAVDADGSVVEANVGLLRWEWVWSKIDGRWIIVDGKNILIDEAGSPICDSFFG